MLVSKHELIQAHELSEFLLLEESGAEQRRAPLFIFICFCKSGKLQQLAQHCVTFRVENTGVVFESWRTGEKL